jgi:hypothetical protein
MGEAKRRRARTAQGDWPGADAYSGPIDLRILPAVPEINGARIRTLTGDPTIPVSDTARIILFAFEATSGERHFHAGFCIGDASGVSAIGIAVIDRLTMEAPGSPLHVVPVVHADIAWDIVLRHLRTFTGELLLFTFPDSDVYDAGVAEVSYSADVRQFGPDGALLGRLTAADRQRLRAEKARILNRPAPPTLYPAGWVGQVDAPWIFRLRTPAGKELRTAIWDGRRDYAREMPQDIARWVGGDKVAIVQVDRPVGVDRRSSLDLTHKLSNDFDGVIHWARNTDTFQSILKSFVRLDLESVSPPELPPAWEPEITILAAGGSDA